MMKGVNLSVPYHTSAGLYAEGINYKLQFDHYVEFRADTKT